MAFALARLPGSFEARDQPFTLAIYAGWRSLTFPARCLPGIIGKPGRVEELGI
jgi:hypothetical protein